MKIKTFGDKRIIIREFLKRDLQNVKTFQDFINSVVKEDVQIVVNKRFSLREEKKWLNSQLGEVRNGKKVFLAAEDKNNNKIVGIICISLGIGRQSHIGNLEICIRDGYRGIGLGKYLMKEIIGLAKKKLEQKFIRLSVFSTNKPALAFYKKLGFKKVARIPKQINYKGKLVDEIIMTK